MEAMGTQPMAAALAKGNQAATDAITMPYERKQLEELWHKLSGLLGESLGLMAALFCSELV